MARAPRARIGQPGSVLVTIRGSLPQLAPSERRVAEVALADPTGTSARTIGELADAASTSQATVVRFAQALGFAGYPELRLALAASAAAERVSGPRIVPGGDISADDDIGAVVAKIAYMDSHAVQETVDQLDQRTLQKVVDRVAKARRVEIYGVGASSIIALDLQMKLHRIGMVSFAWVDHHVAVPSAALLTPRDVAIGISHSGATQDTIDALSEAHTRHATTVALTNFPQSPITAVADFVLTTATRETAFRSGAIASRIAALTVVDCLFAAVAQRDFPATQQALERTFAAVKSRTRRPSSR